MKRLFAILVAGSLGAASFSAQAQQAPDRLRAEAMENTRLLANRIALDDARSVRVRHLTYERLVQESQITTMYSDDPAMRQNKLRVVEQEYTDKLKGLLTTSQFERYEALVAAGTAPTSPHSVSSLKPTAASPK
ncbi:hypothetical protein [Hymenobacter canadensis]|uniref:DUF4168 domain-containing protein n=1 Tax=Hymenobacter canadensis TaxID=2999067 RepID=A0ABY7LJ07_9BACT|nr:hypothetical protein [Hymenobacter canadensis]WBA40428.1 hypothetical protein O3303_11360 [Hymenobacter canadensis]